MKDLSRSWQTLAAGSALTMLVWAVVLSLVAGELIPPVLVFAGLFLVLWGVTLWKPGRASYTAFGVIGLLTILANLPFIIEDLAHPESAFGFNLTTVPLLASLVAVAVGVAAWVQMSDGTASRIGQAAVGLFAVGLVVSVVAAVTLEDDVAQAGDAAVIAKDIEFSPTAVSATAGSIGILVTNDDPIRHTFAIEDLDIEVELPAGTARRVEFSAQAGTYQFMCTVPGHEKMEGTITVG